MADDLWIKQTVETLVWGAVAVLALGALGVRFAIRPWLDARARRRHDRPAAFSIGAHEQRIRSLATEIHGVERALQTLAEADAFHRQLTLAENESENDARPPLPSSSRA